MERNVLILMLVYVSEGIHVNLSMFYKMPGLHGSRSCSSLRKIG